MQNIKFRYLYRDAGNYKNYGEVIFTNSQGKSEEEIEKLIRCELIDGMWFYAHEWNLPNLHFNKYDPQLDHGFHEFEEVCLTIERPMKSAIDINEFCQRIKSKDWK